MTSPDPQLGDVLLDWHEGWAEVRLNRPEKRNALTWALVDRLLEAFAEVAASGRRVAVLAANGPVFCAGGDVEEQRAGRPAPVAEIAHGLADLPLFLIARVEGPVYGGGIALLTACPVVVCTPQVQLALPAAGLVGRFPSGFFAYLDGVIPARALVDHGMRGTPITAERAASYGLVTSVVEPEALDAEVERWVTVALEREQVAEEARAYWAERLAARIARPATVPGGVQR